MCVGTGYPDQCHAKGIPPVGTVQTAEGGGQQQVISKSNRIHSDEQKEKCREAAKLRRSKENEYFQELENLLQVPNQSPANEETQLDKTSLVRLSIAYLKTKKVLNSGCFTSAMDMEKLDAIDVLSCLDGFVLVLSPGGDVIYASDNINRYIGLSSVDILGHPFSSYVHPCDHHQLQLLTPAKVEETVDDHVEILVRVKCTVTERGRMVNLKQASYKSIKISGKTHQMKQEKLEGLTGPVFIGVARVVGPGGGGNQQLGVFTTKHGMDMKFGETDPWLCTVAGYPPHQLLGTSYYTLVHGQDSKMVQRAFTDLAVHGVCETAPYRLLCCTGGVVWVQTVAWVVCKRSKHSRSQAVVCRHNQISEIVNRGEVLTLTQLENQRKSKKSDKDRLLVGNKDHGNSLDRQTSMKTGPLPVSHLLERTTFLTKQGFQTSIKSSIPVIIDRRQSSSHEMNEHKTEGQPNVVTSTLFENSNTTDNIPTTNIDFVQKTKNQHTFENEYVTEHNATYTNDILQTDIMDDADFFRKLEESLQIIDLEQLSPHSGDESVTFDSHATCWPHLLQDTMESKNQKKSCEIKENYIEKYDGIIQLENTFRNSSDMYSFLGYQEEKCKPKDSWETSFVQDMENKHDAIKCNVYKDDFVPDHTKDNQWQNGWTNLSICENLTSTGENYKKHPMRNMQIIENTEQSQVLMNGWTETFNAVSRKREHDFASDLGETFKKIKHGSYMHYYA